MASPASVLIRVANNMIEKKMNARTILKENPVIICPEKMPRARIAMMSMAGPSFCSRQLNRMIVFYNWPKLEKILLNFKFLKIPQY
jgi:predicted nucleotidyltransferase